MPRLLHNMSSSSRSSVGYTPQPVYRRPDPPPEPPPTRAQGAKITDSEVLIMLALNPDWVAKQNDEERWHRMIWRKCLPEIEIPEPDKIAQALCEKFEEAIRAIKFVGCATLLRLPPDKKTSDTNVLSDQLLAAAILSKSSDKLFVASKRPNLAPAQFARLLKTFDPRLIAASRLFPAGDRNK